MRTLNFNNTTVEIEDQSDNFQEDKDLCGVHVKYDSQKKTFYLRLKKDPVAKEKTVKKVEIGFDKNYKIHSTLGSNLMLDLGMKMTLADALTQDWQDMRASLLRVYDMTQNWVMENGRTIA